MKQEKGDPLRNARSLRFTLAGALLLGFVLVVGLRACSSRPAPSTSALLGDEEREARLEAERDDAARKMCADRHREHADKATRARATGQALLLSRLSRNRPEADAVRAAKAGDWRMIRGYAMGGFDPIAVDCGVRGINSPDLPLTLGYRVYSDVIGSCETFGANGDCDIDRQLDDYAPRYNRALVSQPDYPYRDICRPAVAGQAHRLNGTTDYGFADLDSGRAPLTIHEAARRGDIRAMRVFLERDWRDRLRGLVGDNPNDIDADDEFGLDPLQWALAYRRFEAAGWLLARGAKVSDAFCTDNRQTLAIALRAGSDDLAEQIYRRMPQRKRWEPWSGHLLDAAAQGGATRFLARMLAQPHDLNGLASLSSYPPATGRLLAEHKASLCWAGPVPRTARVDVVDIYRAANSTTRRRKNWGQVTLTVTPSLRPRILFLKAHDSVEWKVKARPGARIAGIFVFGLEPGDITVEGASPRVMMNAHGSWCAAAQDQIYSRNHDTALLLSRLIGREHTTLHEEYSAGDLSL